MAYTVLARKYRPQTFSDLVGQEHVTRTLSNAIRSDRVAHAFLFTGVRGVGKTTTARIVAKALNCEQGPTPEPCGVCGPCHDITAGRDTDVLEMDGASNNSVEDVRRLQESIPYRPSRDRFKIVIVDEVHMLSTGAFNAFLKTLEEPPPHVKFIFATTESHKVPVTIRSRCQRYDFRMIPQAVVTRRVREILGAEGIEADDGAVAIVAREAAGSMRDALTLLDQIVAFGGAALVGEEVARVLGIADRDVLHRVASAVLEADGAEALRAVDELASRGLDMLHFARQLVDLVRDMVVLRVCGGDTDLCTLVEEERARARAVAERVELQELHRAFSAVSKVVEDVAQSATPRTTLEMGLVRLATRPPLRPLAELVARLEELERRSGGGGGGGSGGARRGPGGAGHGGGAGRPPARADAPSPSATAMTSQVVPPPASTPTPSRAAPAPASDAAPGPARAPASVPSTGATASSARSASAEPARPSADAPVARTEAAPATDRSASPPEPSAQDRAPAASATPLPSAKQDFPASPTPEAAPQPRAQQWERLVAAIMETKPALGAVLQHGAPLSVTAEHVVVGFAPGSFFGRQVESPESQRTIADLAERMLGGRPRIEVVYGEQRASIVKTLAQQETDRRRARHAATQKKALEHPLVMAVSQMFGVPRERMTVTVQLE